MNWIQFDWDNPDSWPPTLEDVLIFGFGLGRSVYWIASFHRGGRRAGFWQIHGLLEAVHKPTRKEVKYSPDVLCWAFIPTPPREL